MIFTSAAILKLDQDGKLSINDTLSNYFPEYKNAGNMTLHHMLSQRSGIPAIGYDGSINYDSITMLSQSTATLFDYFKDYELLFPPGSKYNHGRSEYILLAAIVERVSGKSFGDFLRDEIFEPLDMHDTGHYRDKQELVENLSVGYTPKDLYDVEPVTPIDWSSKSGHASIYSTSADLRKFGNAILNNNLLNKESWDLIFNDYGNQVGYGWFIRPHLNRTRFQMNGRSPGFSSYFAIYPEEKLSIVVLSNNYISLPANIGMSIAAIVLKEPYEVLNLSNAKISTEIRNKILGKYQFDAKFYVPNYTLEVRSEEGNLICDWGGFIPIDKGELNITNYILRTFWSSIQFIWNESGEIVEMNFDGHRGIKIYE